MLGTAPAPNCASRWAIAMVGGLLVSQILTLYTTPVIYLYLDRLQRWLSPKRRTRMPTLAARMDEVAQAGD